MTITYLSPIGPLRLQNAGVNQEYACFTLCALLADKLFAARREARAHVWGIGYVFSHATISDRRCVYGFSLWSARDDDEVFFTNDPNEASGDGALRTLYIPDLPVDGDVPDALALAYVAKHLLGGDVQVEGA